MRLRFRHIACLVVLLSSLGMAQQGEAARAEHFCGRYIDVLLLRHAARNAQAESAVEAATAEPRDPAAVNALGMGERAAASRVWSVRPAVEQAALLRALNAAPRLA